MERRTSRRNIARTLSGFLLIQLLAAVTAQAGPDAQPADGWLREAMERISVQRMIADIAALSGQEYLGRQTGTPQDQRSAEFVESRFRALRSNRPPEPETDSPSVSRREWRQTAPVMVTTISDRPVLHVDLGQERPPLEAGAEYLPILDSPPALVQAPIVFAGYGVSDDDYAGLDVKDKIVLFLRGKPEHYAGPSAHADKERLAKQKGAAAYLTATGPLLTPYELRRGVTGKPSAFYSGMPESHRLPGAWISTGVAEAIIRGDGTNAANLRDLQEEMNRTGASRSRDTQVAASMKWDTASSPGTLHNAASLVLSGRAPATRETVIIGAHRDHFGRQAGLVFWGADDNASGTAVMLEVARVLAQAPYAPRRSILLLSLSGEEQGLLGSRLYTSDPIVPLVNTSAMINVDHAGIGNGRLTVGVTGLEKTIAHEAGQSAGLADRLDLFGFFPGGDHVPFKEAGVPTITVVSGGVHPHFHQASDTVETIDPDILRSVARFVLAVTWQLANAP